MLPIPPTCLPVAVKGLTTQAGPTWGVLHLAGAWTNIPVPDVVKAGPVNAMIILPRQRILVVGTATGIAWTSLVPSAFAREVDGSVALVWHSAVGGVNGPREFPGQPSTSRPAGIGCLLAREFRSGWDWAERAK